VQNNNAQTTPIPRFAQEQALRVKPMLAVQTLLVLDKQLMKL
jgi:hypothetical protein